MTKGGGESKEEKRDRSKEGSKEERKKRDSEVNNHALHLLNSVSLKAVLVKIIWERWNATYYFDSAIPIRKEILKHQL